MSVAEQPLAQTMQFVSSAGHDQSKTSINRQIAGLDFIRFTAAIFVMFYHLSFVIWAGRHVEVNYHFLGVYGWPGWIGVEVFFVISGFIIPFSAQGALPSAFAKNRALRLYPAALICSTLTAVTMLLARVSPLGPNIIYVWLNTNLLATSGPYLDPSYWTLQVELCFYTLIFLLLLFGRFRHLSAIMGGIGIMSTVYFAAYTLIHHGWLHPHNGAAVLAFADSPLSKIFLITYGCFFATGALLWACLLDRVTPARLTLLCICVAGCLMEIRMRARIDSEFFHTSYSWVPPMLLWSASVAAIIISVKFNAQISGVLGARGAAIARLLGLMTYPLYLIHQRAGYILIAGLHRVMADEDALLITLAALVTMSFGIHVYLERPMQRRLRPLLPGDRQQLAAPEFSRLTETTNHSRLEPDYESSNA